MTFFVGFYGMFEGFNPIENIFLDILREEINIKCEGFLVCEENANKANLIIFSYEYRNVVIIEG
jgi:hypothetical protein